MSAIEKLVEAADKLATSRTLLGELQCYCGPAEDGKPRIASDDLWRRLEKIDDQLMDAMNLIGDTP